MKLMITAFMCAVLLAGTAKAQDFTGTLAQIKQTGVIRIGYRQSLPPMSFVDKDDRPVGYSVEICDQIAGKVQATIGREVKIEYLPVTAENRFKELVDNHIDILCGATTRTLSREEIVDFTQLTFVTGGSFMTLKGNRIVNNFGGKKIGVVKETTTLSSLKQLLAETGTDAGIVLFDDTVDGFKALLEGKIDALSADQVVLIGLALASGNPRQFTVLSELFSYEPFALAVRRNDADFRLVADRVISELYRNGQILKIYDKWFGGFSSGRSTAFEALIKLNAIPE
ncbi:MAG: amino acid ABC transporter substrate-binding protein [Desulfuromonadales bacterium]